MNLSLRILPAEEKTAHLEYWYVLAALIALIFIFYLLKKIKNREPDSEKRTDIPSSINKKTKAGLESKKGQRR